MFINMNIKKIISIALCASVVVTGNNFKSNAMNGGNEAEVLLKGFFGDDKDSTSGGIDVFKDLGKMKEVVKNIGSKYNDKVKNLSRNFLSFLNESKESLEGYLVAMNLMFQEVPRLRFEKAENLDGVIKNIEKYKQYAEGELQRISNSKVIEEIKRELVYLNEVIKFQMENLKHILDELNKQTENIRKAIDDAKKEEEEEEEEDIVEVMSSCVSQISSSIGDSLVAAESFSKFQEEVISSDEVVNKVVAMMKDPLNENVYAVRDMYEIANPKLKLFIYKYLIILKNLGNQNAIDVLRQINPESRQVFYPPENLIEGALSEEQIEKIFAEKKAMDQKYAECMSSVFRNPSFMIEASRQERKDYSIVTNKLVKNKDLLFVRKGSVGYQIWKTFWGPGSVTDKGWKLHVSAQPSSALRVAEIAIPILKKHKVVFKICRGLDGLRLLNTFPVTKSSSETQAGKFITIYPDTPEKSAELAKELDNAFAEAIGCGRLSSCDFCCLVGDAMVGESGAVYTRYGGYDADAWVLENRRLPIFFPADDIPTVSPFKDMKISFNGKDLPYDDCSAWTNDTRYLSKPLSSYERNKDLAGEIDEQESRACFPPT